MPTALEFGTSGGFLIDSNVLLDVITQDPIWYEWSSSALADAARRSRIHINQLIFAEVSTRFESPTELDELLPPRFVRRASLPYDAAFLAAKAFMAYRRNGGDRSSPMPDFSIGAHAVVERMTLVTRDATRYRTYFPTLKLIAP
jgi:predicted nucleic acid-binding protein